VLEVLSACVKAARDVTRAGILWHALWPPLVAVTLWAVVATATWAHGIAMISDMMPHFEWAAWAWLAHWAAVFLLLAGFGALAYGTTLLLVAVFALPFMLAQIAARDYPDVVRHGENPFWGSLGNTLLAGAIFTTGWLVTLPLLLVPGVVLVLPLCWTAWLNQRTFRFDALAEHATRNEVAAIVAMSRSRFYVAGLWTGVVAHIPLLNLLAPAYAALVFTHLGLGSLRSVRRTTGVEL
jgi:CysZ protein